MLFTINLCYQTCSRGTACNFIHCFRNPGGDYEWADWDKPPPRYWMNKMTALFGHSDESGYDKQMEQENFRQLRKSSKMLSADRDRCVFVPGATLWAYCNSFFLWDIILLLFFDLFTYVACPHFIWTSAHVPFPPSN